MSSLKISNTGIEISSDRYLTDNATGLFFLLNLIVLYNYDYIEFCDVKMFSSVSLNVILGVIALLLTTAVGLIVSCIAFVTLEIPYLFCEYIWWELKWPLYPIQFVSDFKSMTGDLQYKYWHRNLVCFEEVLKKEKVNIDRFLIQRGIRVLLRNISFILLFNSIIIFIKDGDICHWIVLAALLLLIVSSYIGFFANVGLLLIYKIHFPNASLNRVYTLDGGISSVVSDGQSFMGDNEQNV